MRIGEYVEIVEGHTPGEGYGTLHCEAGDKMNAWGITGVGAGIGGYLKGSGCILLGVGSVLGWYCVLASSGPLQVRLCVRFALGSSAFRDYLLCLLTVGIRCEYLIPPL